MATIISEHQDDVSAPEPHKWNEFYPDAAPVTLKHEADEAPAPVVCATCGQGQEGCTCAKGTLCPLCQGSGMRFGREHCHLCDGNGRI